MIFFGPPGTGKTTVANIIAQTSGMQLHKLNATTASLSDIKDVISLEVIPYKFNKEADFIKVFDGDDRVKMMEYIEKLSSIKTVHKTIRVMEL